MKNIDWNILNDQYRLYSASKKHQRFGQFLFSNIPELTLGSKEKDDALYNMKDTGEAYQYVYKNLI